MISFFCLAVFRYLMVDDFDILQLISWIVEQLVLQVW